MIPTLAMNNKHIAYINVDIVIISLQLSLTLLLSTNIQFHMYVLTNMNATSIWINDPSFDLWCIDEKAS